MTDSVSSRRTFLKAGALIAAPLAATVPTAVLAAGGAPDTPLADEAAIRRLHQGWLRAINTGASAPQPGEWNGGVRSIVGDPVGEPDTVRVAADGKRATGRFACTVESVTELPMDSTFAQMAHAQGGGSARASEQGTLTFDYTKSADGWAIARITFDRA